MELPSDTLQNFTLADRESLEKRLRSRAFNLHETKAATQGQVLPVHLGRLVTQHAVVRGIRHHESFAFGPAAVLRGIRPLFTRALNARAIMSNIVPNISASDEFPYCIWYPDLPSRETLIEVAARYPEMKYQVGRTCAIAGYCDVYRSLDLLPEVAIAEEARESGHMDIYEDILKAHTKWRIFDDFTGTMHCSDPRPAKLNGDTCIRNWLSLTQPVLAPVGLVEGEEGDPTSGDEGKREQYMHSQDFEISGFPGFRTPPYDITEDKQLDIRSSGSQPWFRTPDWDPRSSFADAEDDYEGPKKPLPELPGIVKRLLYEPLPEDLPTCDKDWLIRMAAYTGNVDRYARLRRPWFVEDELRCVERGIYHNVLFARWWATQITKDTSPIIRKAVNARYIMSNDLSRVLDRNLSTDLPYHIWHPDVARIETYKALAVHMPEMRPQVVRAAIYADYQDLFDLLMNGSSAEADASTSPSDDDDKPVRASDVYMHYGPLYGSAPLQPVVSGMPAAPSDRASFFAGITLLPTEPDHYLFLEAHFSPNPHYKTILLEKAAGLGLDITSPNPYPYISRRRRLECVGEAHKQRRPYSPDWLGIGTGAATFTCEATSLESYVLLPDEWRPSPEDVSRWDTGKYYLLDYSRWPRSVWAVVDKYLP